MAKYITHLDVSLDEAEEQQLQAQGFKKINVNLNEGAGGRQIYIWYKCGSVPITRLQVTFNDPMAVGLINAGYTKIPKNLNAGACGDVIYLWYFRGSGEYDVPIVEIEFTTDATNEAQKFKDNWERLACDLNRGVGGKWIYAWVRRETQTYICDVTATASYGSDKDKFRNGYIRVDDNTNRRAGGSTVFIWYRQTTNSERAICELNVSTDDNQRQALQQQNYQPVSVNLNEGTGGNQVYLWYKRDKVSNPIKAIILLVNAAQFAAHEKAGATVIKRDLNEGNHGLTEYLCVAQ